MPLILSNPIRAYAWGSPTVIPELLGVPPTGEPQAELWIGAHPGAPSIVELDGSRVTLAELIEKDPEGTLGPATLRRFGPRLPYLLKILAIDQPLSIQAHPTIEQAELGFAAEEAAGVPIDAPQRLYRDRMHKPEMIVALTDVTALLGFGQPAESADLMAELDVPDLRDDAATLRKAGLEPVVRRWLLMPDDEVAVRVAAVVEAAGSSTTDLGHLIVRLGERYPSDRGVLLALLMRHERLRRGEAVFIPAGVPHCYLTGVAVEAQASSDNTLRAGLTPKHVDAAELARVLRYEAEDRLRVLPQRVGSHQAVFAPPVDEFELAELALTDTPITLGAGEPRVVLVTAGSAQVSAGGGTVRLARGRAAFVPAGEGAATILGSGTAYVVSPGADLADTAR
ncbi:MAG TPA: mannose-6-phosphate isomerase, class I [Jiangellaceae bacterium]